MKHNGTLFVFHRECSNWCTLLRRSLRAGCTERSVVTGNARPEGLLNYPSGRHELKSQKVVKDDFFNPPVHIALAVSFPSVSSS